jgi:hypothetical protein
LVIWICQSKIFYPTRNIISGVSEAHNTDPTIFLVVFAIIGLRLIQIFVSKTPITSLPFGGNPFWVWTAWGVAALVTGLALYVLGRLPLYLARGLIWTARGNHERRIGFCGLGILCIGFILQAAVNLM